MSPQRNVVVHPHPSLLAGVTPIRSVGSSFPISPVWGPLSPPARRMLNEGQEKRGNHPSDVFPIVKVHAESTSMKGVAVSREIFSSLSSSGQERPPVTPQKSPAFQKKSLVGSSSSPFDESKQKYTHARIDSFMQNESQYRPGSDSDSDAAGEHFPEGFISSTNIM